MPKKEDNQSQKSAAAQASASSDAILAAIAKQGTELSRVCELVNAMKESMEGRFDSIEKSLSALQRDYSEVKQRLGDVDAALTAADTRITALEATCGELQSANSALKAKLLDLEGRSRRLNIRIVGIPEGVEHGRPTEFVSALIPKILGEEHFGKPLKVDRAHRISYAQTRTVDKPRVMIAKLHHYSDVGKIFRLSRQLGKLTLEGKPVHIFPDFAPEISAQRLAYNNVKKKLKDAGAVCSFRYPAKLQVLYNSATNIFNCVSDAERFVSALLPNP